MAATAAPATLLYGLGQTLIAPLPHRGRGWPRGESPRSGEGASTVKPSLSHRCAMGPSLSRGAGEGLLGRQSKQAAGQGQVRLVDHLAVERQGAGIGVGGEGGDDPL